jgi:hypothetical protein
VLVNTSTIIQHLENREGFGYQLRISHKPTINEANNVLLSRI